MDTSYTLFIKVIFLPVLLKRTMCYGTGDETIWRVSYLCQGVRWSERVVIPLGSISDCRCCWDREKERDPKTEIFCWRERERRLRETNHGSLEPAKKQEHKQPHCWEPSTGVLLVRVVCCLLVCFTLKWRKGGRSIRNDEGVFPQRCRKTQNETVAHTNANHSARDTQQKHARTSVKMRMMFL